MRANPSPLAPLAAALLRLADYRRQQAERERLRPVAEDRPADGRAAKVTR